jgi:hypothetical protein
MLSSESLTHHIFFETSITACRRFDALDFLELILGFTEDQGEVSTTEYLHHEVSSWSEESFSNF